MSRIPKWFERKFPQTTSADAFPNLVCRLRGTPAHLEELLRDLPRQVLTAADGCWSIQENAGHLIDLERLWDVRLSHNAALEPETSGGAVEAIHVTPAKKSGMVAVGEARAYAGRGLEGDRYLTREGTFSPKRRAMNYPG